MMSRVLTGFICAMKKDSPAAASTAVLFAWALYDWANSAFATVIQTFVFAAYFARSVAIDETTGTAQWGTVTGIAGIVIAVGGPILGAIADQTGRRKPWLACFTLLCSAATALLWFVRPSPDFVAPALALVALGTLGAEFSFIFYNAMLPDLAPANRIGRWSGWGWSLGYAGGLACLIVALFAFVQPNSWIALDRESAEHVRATFLLAAGWCFVFALPLFILTPDAHRETKGMGRAIKAGLQQLRDSIRNVRRYSHIARFLVAHLVFIDGLATVFAFGGVYAAGTFNMSEQQVLLFGIALNVTAGIGAALFAWIDDMLGSRKTILLGLIGLALPTAAMLMVRSQLLFWILGLALGIFVGPVQAASRSYLARSAPEHLRTQMFGLYALSGKATAFLGPLLVGWLTYVSASQRIGMSAILLFFIAGFLLMLTVPAAPKNLQNDQL
jgi:MFS transporter, UMF1 family